MEQATAKQTRKTPHTPDLLLKIKQLEDMNHIMAHDLRGASANIRMLTDLLLERQNGSTEPQGEDIFTDQEILHYIDRSSNALMRTLNDLMEIVNSELNRKIAMVDCDIEDIAHNVIDQMNGMIFSKHAKIMLRLAVKHCSYVRVYLESVLYNLISNSIKYSRPGVPLKIDIKTYLKNGRTVLEVKDNGMGIDLAKHGDKLFQLNQVFHGGQDSHGIGLYMTREHIEAMGGRISVESKVNVGTQFTVTL